jgi:hypothetical protein
MTWHAPVAIVPTVSAMEVVADSVPEVPVIVTGYVPATAVAAAVNVTTLELADEAGLNEAVTPLGRPDAANNTLPANGLTSFTVIVSVPLAPGRIESASAEGVSVKPPAAVIVIVIVVVLVNVPEVPMTVIGYVPTGIEQLAVKVSILLPPVIGLVPKPTVKPVGKPDADSVMLPVNPLMPVTGIANEPEPHCGIVKDPPGPMVKLGCPVTVSVIVVVTGVSVPEVPVMVIGYVPARVVAATAKVTTLELAEEVGLNDAVTPVGRPEVANDTLPVNGLTSVTVMVSVALEPGAIDSVGAEGASVKFP